MTIQHLTPSDYITTKWSGGLTTQLGIAPAGAVYADRDFLWRLSSATVEDAESDFTALPDYERLISTLEGTIELNHNGGEKLTLKDVENFSKTGEAVEYYVLLDISGSTAATTRTPGAAAATSTSCSARASARARCAASTLRRSSTRPSTAARA